MMNVNTIANIYFTPDSLEEFNACLRALRECPATTTLPTVVKPVTDAPRGGRPRMTDRETRDADTEATNKQTQPDVASPTIDTPAPPDDKERFDFED